MKKATIIGHMVIASIILLLVPLVFYYTGYHWQITDDSSPIWQWFWLLITQTGSLPFVAIMIIGLLVFLWRFGGQHNWKTLLVLVVLSMGLTQIAKKSLKNYFAEPRPYIAQIYHNDIAKIQTFYREMTPQAKRSVIQQYYQAHPETINALAKHRIHEIAYGFPSGHTIFVASWLLIFVGLGQRRWALLVITCWAVLVMSSRLLLGMHLPEDLAASIPLAFIINLPLLLWYRSRKNIHYN